jgi:hypothetical protein
MLRGANPVVVDVWSDTLNMTLIKRWPSWCQDGSDHVIRRQTLADYCRR